MKQDIAPQIIAFVMKRHGEKEISASDFYLTLSMQLQWCPPHLAKRFVHHALQEKLLMKKGPMLTANFSLKEVTIPTGFKPSLEFFQKYTPKQTSLDSVVQQDLLSLIHSSTSISQKEFQTKIEHIMTKKQISKNIALLLIAKKYRIPIDSYFDSIEKTLLKENRE